MIYVFLVVSGLFATGLLARQILNRRLCVICVSVALTWLGLLILYRLDRFLDTTLLSLLMGQSISGLYYFVKQRVPKVMQLFTLPFFLSLTAFFYMLIKAEVTLPAFGLLLGLWAIAWLIFTYRNDPAKQRVVKAATECCEDNK